MNHQEKRALENRLRWEGGLSGGKAKIAVAVVVKWLAEKPQNKSEEKPAEEVTKR